MGEQYPWSRKFGGRPWVVHIETDVQPGDLIRTYTSSYTFPQSWKTQSQGSDLLVFYTEVVIIGE